MYEGFQKIADISLEKDGLSKELIMYEGIEKLASNVEKNRHWKDVGVSAGAGLGLAGAGYGAEKLWENRSMNALAQMREAALQDYSGNWIKRLFRRNPSPEAIEKFRKSYNSPSMKMTRFVVDHNLAKYLQGGRGWATLGALTLLGGAGTYGGLQLVRKKRKPTKLEKDGL